MAKITKATIEAKGIEIAVQTTSGREDYFSLTDIARFQNPESPASVINHWMSPDIMRLHFHRKNGSSRRKPSELFLSLEDTAEHLPIVTLP